MSNDFDETLPGPFEWDLKRLVASFAVGGRDLGFSVKDRRGVNLAVTRAYREAMAGLASMKTFDLWYSRVDAETLIAEFQSAASGKRRKLMEKNLAKTRAKDSLRAFSKLTTIVDGEPRIISDPPLLVPIEDLSDGRDIEAFARSVNRGYRRTLQGDRKHLLERFHYVHAARKVVGVGSVGTRAWIMLMVGRDNDDPLFLQLKEAQPSVLEPFLGKSQYTSHGQRVVEGQRLMQAASDIMLGWHGVTGLDGVKRDFYFRQLWDEKGSAIIEGMKPRELAAYAAICGRTLARGHARSGERGHRRRGQGRRHQTAGPAAPLLRDRARVVPTGEANAVAENNPGSLGDGESAVNPDEAASQLADRRERSQQERTRPEGPPSPQVLRAPGQPRRRCCYCWKRSGTVPVLSPRMMAPPPGRE